MKKEVKIGLIFLIVIAFFIWGLNFLKGSNILKKDNEFCGIFTNVSGLNVSSDVHANGLTVGRVSNIRFLDNNPNLLLVTIAVKKSYNLPENSIIEIYSKDLLGSKAINLLRGDSNAMAEPGDTLDTKLQADIISSAMDIIVPLRIKAENMLSSIDSVMRIIQSTINPETQENIRNSLASLNDILSTGKTQVYSILNNMESISENIENNNNKINHIMTNLEDFTGQLASMDIKNIELRLNSTLTHTEGIIGDIKNGKGSLGLLLTDDSAYNNLQSSLTSLDSLLVDFRLRPKRYVHFSVFGRKDK